MSQKIFPHIILHFCRLFSHGSYILVKNHQMLMVEVTRLVAIIAQQRASLGALLSARLVPLITHSCVMKSINRSHHINPTELSIYMLCTYWA